MSNRTGIIAIAILAIHFLFTQLFTDYFSKAPLREVIDLKSTYSEKFDIYVPMEQTYQVNMLFDREEKEFEYLKSVLGNMTNKNENGIPLNIEWVLSEGSAVVKSEELMATNSCGWSQAQVYRCLGKFKVPPGDYQFNIVIKSPHSEFSNFKTHLSINYNFKNAHTWQTAYIFWGMLFNVFVAPFIGGIIFLILIVRYIRHLTSH